MEGSELRRLRKKLGLTQVELARKLGTTGNTVARWERSELPIRPSAALLVKLLAKLERRS